MLSSNRQEGRYAEISGYAAADSRYLTGLYRGEGTMFYVLFILLFIIIFMLYQHHRERHTIPFTLVLVAYFFAIFSMMIYYSRDAYY